MEGEVTLSPGEVICEGRYQIDSMLGRGGMGIVYKARSLSLKRDVAIKMLTHADDELLRRFSREAALMAQVDHPAVVKIFDFRDSGKWGPLLVMEYLQGRDLGRVLKGPMVVAEAVEIILGVCGGAYACHKHDIVHRDIKPRNVFLIAAADWRERIKIVDFGLAIPHNSPLLQALQTRFTQTGAVVGTPRFIAPELLRGEEPTGQCDQYAIALLLYMALTGRTPFFDLEGKELVAAIRRGDYLAPQLLRADLSPELVRILVRALDVDPERRFGSVAEFAFSLIPFAATKTGGRWTRLFTDASRPVPRELLEPVSAQRVGQSAVPPMSKIEPIFAPETAPAPPIIQLPYSDPPTAVQERPLGVVPKERPAPPPLPPAPRPAPVAQPALHLVTQPEASISIDEPVIQTPQRDLPLDRRYARHLLSAFAAGTLFGALLTIAIFFIFYLGRARQEPSPAILSGGQVSKAPASK